MVKKLCFGGAKEITVNDIGRNIVLQIDLKLDYFSFIAGQNKTTGSKLRCCIKMMFYLRLGGLSA